MPWKHLFLHLMWLSKWCWTKKIISSSFRLCSVLLFLHLEAQQDLTFFSRTANFPLSWYCDVKSAPQVGEKLEIPHCTLAKSLQISHASVNEDCFLFWNKKNGRTEQRPGVREWIGIHCVFVCECESANMHMHTGTHIGHKAHVITVNSISSKQQQLFCVIVLVSVCVSVSVLCMSERVYAFACPQSLCLSLSGCWLWGTHCKSICVFIFPMSVCMCVFEALLYYTSGARSQDRAQPNSAEQSWKGPRASSLCTPPTSHLSPSLSLSHAHTAHTAVLLGTGLSL